MADPGDPWGILEARAAITKPGGAVTITAGIHDPQTVIDANPPGTVYWFDGGFAMAYAIEPKDGDTLLTNNATLDGGATWITGDALTKGSIVAGVQTAIDIRGTNPSITGKEDVVIAGFQIQNYTIRGIQPWLGSYLHHNLIHHCYRNALGSGYQHTPYHGGADPQTIVEDTIIWYCGSANELGSGAGGIKQAGTGDLPFADDGSEVTVGATPGSGITYERVYLWHNIGNGLWHDVASGGDIIHDCIAKDNGRKGFYYEVCTGPVEMTELTSERNVQWYGEIKLRKHSTDSGIGFSTCTYVHIEDCRVSGQVGKNTGILVKKTARENRFGHGTDHFDIVNNNITGGDILYVADIIYAGTYPTTDENISNNTDEGPTARGASWDGEFDASLVDSPVLVPVPTSILQIQAIGATASNGNDLTFSINRPSYGATLIAFFGCNEPLVNLRPPDETWIKVLEHEAFQQSLQVYQKYVNLLPDDDDDGDPIVEYTFFNDSATGTSQGVMGEYISPEGGLTAIDSVITAINNGTSRAFDGLEVTEVPALFLTAVTLANTSGGFSAPTGGYSEAVATSNARMQMASLILDPEDSFGEFDTTQAWVTARNVVGIGVAFVPAGVVLPGVDETANLPPFDRIRYDVRPARGIWDIAGHNIEPLEWRCTDIVRDFGEPQGGYDESWVRIDRNTYDRYKSEFIQGARILAETNRGDDLWQGVISGPVQELDDGTFEITGQGLQHDARRQNRRLLVQSRDYSQWIEMDSEELKYTQSEKLFAKNDRGKLVLGHGKEDTIATDKRIGYAFYVDDGEVRYVGFDTERTGTMPNRQIAVQSADTIAGSLTDEEAWNVEDLTTLDSLEADIPRDKPQIVILFRTTAEITSVDQQRVYITGLRVGGLARDRNFLDPSAIAEMIAHELKWPVRHTQKAGFNALPFDIVDGDWASAGLDYLSLLSDFTWRVDFNGLVFRPWGFTSWVVRRSEGTTENLQVLPFYNRARVKFSKPSGNQGELVRRADPDPLAGMKYVNEYVVELPDPQPDRELANKVADRILSQGTKLRYAGQVHAYRATRLDGSGNIMEMKAGDELIIEDWQEAGFSGKHRIHEVEKTSGGGVTIGINEEVSISRRLARSQLRRRKRGRY